MSYRLVTGTVYRTWDVPWVDAPVTFRRSKGSFTHNNQYPRDGITCRTDSLGRLVYWGYAGVPLWCNEEGIIPSEYECILPNDDIFSFTLSPGTDPVDLSILRESGVTVTYGRIKTYFSFGDASPKIITKNFQGTVHSASIIIQIPFNGNASLRLGDAINLQRLIPSNYNDPYAIAEYQTYPSQNYASTDILLSILVDSSVTQGNGIVVLEV